MTPARSRSFNTRKWWQKSRTPGQQISLDEGRKLDPECEVGDSLGIKMDASAFGRIAAQSAKQVIMQRMKDAERDLVFEDFKDRKGEIINGIVQRVDPEGIIVNLGRTEALLPPSEQVPREIYHKGERIRALRPGREAPDPGTPGHPVPDPSAVPGGPVRCRGAGDFRRHRPGAGLRPGAGEPLQDRGVLPGFGRGPGGGLRRHEGGPGCRTSCRSCGARRSTSSPGIPDPAKFATSALSPAQVSRIILSQESQSMEVIVPDDQLSLAIGKRGQNVRLASRLVGWKIDVKSESKYSKSLKEGYLSLLSIPGVGEITASLLA